MSFPIRPRKVTCAGLIGIIMVLPNSIWKDPDARTQTTSVVTRAARAGKVDVRDSVRSGVKFRKVPR